ncbi:MAG: lipoyl(octanoyl) transferase LipB [Actinobacteria bacterium]|nr:lipoyl(octanoyl) transferase LipB [Actinomycetota bacterium]
MHCLDLGENYVDYQQAWDLQREIHSQVVAGELSDQVLLLEHSSVYTAGRRTEIGDRPIDGRPVVDVDRGGKITWHGPGQLVGYPIVHLPNPMDVVSHVRRLEDVLIGVCSDFGLATARIKGRSGVWVADEKGERKLAAIGVRVAQGATMHGFALNCSNELTDFGKIVPCGISDAGVSTLSAELGETITPTDVLTSVTAQLHLVFDGITAQSAPPITA